jgi:CHAT domain-containing protein
VVGRELIAPIAERLRPLGLTRVHLIAGGKLSLLPLHAAPYPVAGRSLCLLDEMDVSFIPAARVLTATQAALKRRQERPISFLGVADPQPHPLALVHARHEIRQIASLPEWTECRLLMGEEATRDALIRAAGGATHVHLACHGHFDSWAPLGSHLDLACGERLPLRDIQALDSFPQSRLVVLSACQTAVSEFQNLPDEMLGLVAGFLQVGIPGVIGALWSVDDLSTALLMIRFYEGHLRGDGFCGEGPMEPARALRRAQLWLRAVTVGELHRLLETVSPEAAAGLALRLEFEEDEAARPFADPYFWAPFVLAGV